ncbi:MAG: 4-alpha-glucanotransferase [Planctomycetes bacterium]|jgi:4-alpha-glucanotransferase|nr:4-alpha-glucanotransferase [Planctomycetota bacterium]
MHVTSLPSRQGIGDLGPEAYKFVDFLQAAGQNYWQVLPLNHTMVKTGHSPYNCLSAFAGNPLLISPDLLYEDGLLTKREVSDPPAGPAEAVHYEKVTSYKEKLLAIAFTRFNAAPRPPEFSLFVEEHRAWLEPYADFVSLRRHHRGRLWSDWPTALRDRDTAALDAVRRQLAESVERERFCQYIFYRQYLRLKRYANERGIQVAGDVPIYVAYDSADVWAHPDLFRLTRDKKPRFVAGVPPDYFSATGQLWGNPVYDWPRLEETGFAWWMGRIKHNLVLFDFVRIDHFRGLIAYWEVPASHKNAMRGKWAPVPHDRFLRELFRHSPLAAIFVEDLGQITPDVREVIAQYRLPRMTVLQFAFGGDPARNPYLPHNHAENSIVYTGTHDNNTTRGWFEKEMKGEKRRRLFDYLGRRVPASDIAWEMMRVAMCSVARLAVAPMQDVLSLGSEARMNLPAKQEGNWRWRMRPGRLDPRLAERLRKLTETCGRT